MHNPGHDLKGQPIMIWGEVEISEMNFYPQNAFGINPPPQERLSKETCPSKYSQTLLERASKISRKKDLRFPPPPVINGRSPTDEQSNVPCNHGRKHWNPKNVFLRVQNIGLTAARPYPLWSSDISISNLRVVFTNQRDKA